jgi:ATP-dependent 26S proteasome regulatory subunit
MFDMPDNNQKMRLFNLKLKQFKSSENIITEFIHDMEIFSHADVERAALEVIKQCILDGRRMYNKNDVEKAILQQKEMVSLRKTQYRSEANG